jgi:quercetin dioxygenase-like cupin family protein
MDKAEMQRSVGSDAPCASASWSLNSLLEVGITRYGAEGGRELPHTHRHAFEFQYMLAGLSAYLDMVTGEEHVFRKGDFYVIEQGVVYAEIAAPHGNLVYKSSARKRQGPSGEYR